MRPWLVTLLIVTLLAWPRQARAAPTPPGITAPDAVAIDGWSGAVLYAKNPDQLHDPASTVKIMTGLLVLEKKIALQHVFTVSPYAASFSGSTAGLYAGEAMTVWNLLHGLLMPSGNDAAMALAEDVSGSVDRFVAQMNAEARRLHLWHTRFLTPTGLDVGGQVTTARDLARLARTAMLRLPFARVVKTRSWTAWSADRRIFHHWYNLNKLLWASRAVNGIKTGTTAGAGACLVSSAREAGKWVIAVNLGSTSDSRFSDGAALLNYGIAVDGAPPSTIDG